MRSDEIRPCPKEDNPTTAHALLCPILKGPVGLLAISRNVASSTSYPHDTKTPSPLGPSMTDFLAQMPDDKYYRAALPCPYFMCQTIIQLRRTLSSGRRCQKLQTQSKNSFLDQQKKLLCKRDQKEPLLFMKLSSSSPSKGNLFLSAGDFFANFRVLRIFF